MKKQFSLFLALILSLSVWAKVQNNTPTTPGVLGSSSGYYKDANGKKGSVLFSALHSISGGVTYSYYQLSYDDLWTAFKTSDVYPSGHPKEGKIWDMYATCDYTPGDDQGSSSATECTGGYNREHSLPKSWWGNSGNAYKSTAYGCDLGHLIPTDVHVNGIRSAFPFGEVVTANYNFAISKQGTSGTSLSVDKNTISGTSTTFDATTVFEPSDDYKGDLARMYMYMRARYSDLNLGQTAGGVIHFTTTTDAANDSKYGWKDYSVILLMKWHRQDPVSQKEIDRNNAMERLQGNRNPFIDYPILAEYLWGDKSDQTFYLNDALGSFDPAFKPGISDGSRIATPLLLFPTSDVDFGLTTSKVPVNYDVYIKGQDLTSGTVSLAITGADANLFSLTESSLTKTEVEDGYYVVVTYAPTGDGDHSATLTISGCGITNHQIQLTGSCFDPKATVTFYDKGKTYSVITDMIGESIVLEPPTPCDDYSFAGWSTNNYDVTNTDLPDLNYTGVIPETNTTYYAVYTRSVVKTIMTNDYKKIVSLEDLASDTYLIVAENNGLQAMSSQWVATYYLKPVLVTAEENIISTTDATIIWQGVVDSENSLITFYQPDQGFLYIEKNVNGDKTYYNIKLGDNETDNKFSYTLLSSGAWIFSSATYTDRQLEYYSAKSNWTFHTKQGAPVYIYKHHNAETITTFYTTSPQCTVTSIDTIDLDPLSPLQTKKILLDGQLYILRDGKVYNLQGARVR